MRTLIELMPARDGAAGYLPLSAVGLRAWLACVRACVVGVRCACAGEPLCFVRSLICLFVCFFRPVVCFDLRDSERRFRRAFDGRQHLFARRVPVEYP